MAPAEQLPAEGGRLRRVSSKVGGGGAVTIRCAKRAAAGCSTSRVCVCVCGSDGGRVAGRGQHASPEWKHVPWHGNARCSGAAKEALQARCTAHAGAYACMQAWRTHEHEQPLHKRRLGGRAQGAAAGQWVDAGTASPPPTRRWKQSPAARTCVAATTPSRVAVHAADPASQGTTSCGASTAAAARPPPCASSKRRSSKVWRSASQRQACPCDVGSVRMLPFRQCTRVVVRGQWLDRVGTPCAATLTANAYARPSRPKPPAAAWFKLSGGSSKSETSACGRHHRHTCGL